MPPGGGASSVEDRINLHQLMELKAAFERADTDNGGSLDMDEFLEAFGGVLGKNLAKKQLMHLFMKIDANSDGSVDWDEFTNFMLLENQATADMSDRTAHARFAEAEVQPSELNPKSAVHKDMIEGILLLPKHEKMVSHARDGTIRAWNASNLQHLRTVKVSDAWVTDCKYFEKSNRLAASTIDRSISLFDNSSYELTGQISGLDTSPLCLGTSHDVAREKLIVGDDCGNISLYDVNAERFEAEQSMSAPTLRLFREKRHSDWVTKVCYYPDPNFMVSSSLDGTLKIGELERRPRFARQFGEDKHAKGSYHAQAAKKGVHSFDWSNNFKVLASCGLERNIALWNPYTRSAKPLQVLQGHNASVFRVVVNDDNYQLLSCSVDKYIKVWDMRNYKCLQTLIDKSHYRPENRISAFTYDPVRMQLLTGTTQIKVWPMLELAKRNIEAGHEFPICAALYNNNFHQVVSGDESAQVCVWDVESGDLVFHFAGLHAAKMTCMTFDEAGRRLITGGNDGTVRMWNFSNGQCLKELKTESKLEVSSVMFILEGQNKLIVAGGWNRKVLVWRDDASSSTAAVEPDRRMSGHGEDILSIAFSSPNLLATSGYDGRVLIWNMDSGVVKFTLSIPNLGRLEVDQRAIWQLIFLDCRSQALCGTSADGFLRFWNVKEGVLVWEQHAQHRPGETIIALASDATNSFLYTGDTAGCLKLWDIHGFVNVAGLSQENNVIELHHWKAHQGSIASLDYIDRHEMLLSSGSDGKVKMWHVTGESIALAGVLGDSAVWNLADPTTFRRVQEEPSTPRARVAATIAAAAEDMPVDTPRSLESPRKSSEQDVCADDDDDGEEGESGASDGEADFPSDILPPPALPDDADPGGDEELYSDATPDQQNTKELIYQILNRNAGKDPRRNAPQVPTMHRLRIHGLAEVPASPRGTTPR